MPRTLAVPVLAALLALSGCNTLASVFLRPQVSTAVQTLREGAYSLDTRHAALTFRIDHLGFSDYVGRFERFTASLDFDPDAPQAAKLEAIVDMTSLDVADDEFAATLIGPGWLDTPAHPQAVFRSTAITLTGPDTGEVTGDLTLFGVSAPVTLAVTFRGGGTDRLRGGAQVLGFSARGSLDRTVFGLDRLAGLVGTDVRFEIEAEFIRR
jgi:polyisoprenoid-binding protein YceI